MDNWNNEQQPEMSVNGQFSGNPYQDQNAYNQTTNDAGVYSGQPNTNMGYSQPNVNTGYGQPNASTGYSQPNANTGYGQPNANTGYGQPNANTGYSQPQNNYANGYSQPYANYNQSVYQGQGYSSEQKEEPVGVGEWTGLLAIASFVPCIGFILMLVWAFGGTEKKSKSNFCKAYLIIALIRVALYVLIFIIWGTTLTSLIDSF